MVRSQRCPPFTNYTKTFQGTLDHIIHNKQLRLLSILDIPDESEVKKEVALPSKLFPSDHVRLEARF